MKQNRIDRIMAELEGMGVSQMLIVDPMSIFYLTGVYNDPHAPLPSASSTRTAFS